MSVQTTYSDAPSAAYSGLLIGADHEIVPMVNAEASAEMPFGAGICRKTSSPATDQDAILPAAEGDMVWGILVHSNIYDRTYTLADGTTAGELGTTGVKPGAMLNILRRGLVWVYCRKAIEVGDRLWIRAVASGGSPAEFLGAPEPDDDSTDMIDCTGQGVFESSCGAGGFAKLRVDFTNVG